VVVAMVRKFTAGEGDRGVDQGRVWDRDACNDAGHVREYSNHSVNYESD
jgi:hypothetical protein